MSGEGASGDRPNRRGPGGDAAGHTKGATLAGRALRTSGDDAYAFTITSCFTFRNSFGSRMWSSIFPSTRRIS